MSARASAVAGDREGTERYLLAARSAAAKIAEDEDRELLLADVKGGPSTSRVISRRSSLPLRIPTGDPIAT